MINFIKNKFNLDFTKKIVLIIIIFLQLFYIVNKKIQFRFDTIINSLNKDFGSHYVIPKEVLEIKKIILKKKFKDFNVSKKYKENNYLYQRTIEFLYPVKINKNNKKIFHLPNDEIPYNCSILDKFKHIILIKC